jgi:hypothetical protein
MALPTEELLRKATFTTTDFGGAGEAPLSIEQVEQFIELMSAEQVMLSDVRQVTSMASKWQESIIDFASRIARPGVEATRLSDGDRVKPSTGLVELSTVLLRAEVPVSDEVMEDNVARERIVGSLERTIASRFGFDVEDLMVNGDTGSGDPFIALLDGWLKQAVDSGNSLDATSIGQDYQEIFRRLLTLLPDRFKRNLETDYRFYVPKRLEEKYRDILADRGTALGDLMLTGKNEVTYQGILVRGVPSFAITSATPDTSHVLLSHRSNLYAGFHRNIKFETWRDPREGAMSFIVTSRVDAKVAVPEATSVAENVDVEP